MSRKYKNVNEYNTYNNKREWVHVVEYGLFNSPYSIHIVYTLMLVSGKIYL
jgi:hypothetical protein